MADSDSSVVRQVLVDIGFPRPTELGSLRSIAHLFGTSKRRSGIYALVLPEDCVYIGQAKDVVRRFGQHRQAHDEIVAFAFIPTRIADLDATERQKIFQAERPGLTLTNVTFATNVVGDADLDDVVSRKAQERWLADPLGENTRERESAASLVLPRPQLERYASRFNDFAGNRSFTTAVNLLGRFRHGAIPYPRATEYSFWAVSCLPSTNAANWPRYLCVSAGVMELFVLGYFKEEPSGGEMWGFVNVASDVLFGHFGSQEAFLASFPFVEVGKRGYRDAGQNQLTLYCDLSDHMDILLCEEHVMRAAGTLALRVMRKRATIYSRFHCKQLADVALSESQNGWRLDSAER